MASAAATRCQTGPADKRRRLERIRAAKAALEAEAAAPEPPDGEAGPGPSTGMQDRGRPKRAADGGPPDKAQRNFTDPDSRIQPTRDGFIQGYNAQIAVDAAHQVIVAHRLQTNPGDVDGLVPLVDAVRRHLGAKPREVSADAGFCSEADLAALGQRRIRPLSRRRPRPARHRHPGHRPPPRQFAADPRHGRNPRPSRAAQPLPAAKTGRRAGVRPDQAGSRHAAIPDARSRQGQG